HGVVVKLHQSTRFLKALGNTNVIVQIGARSAFLVLRKRRYYQSVPGSDSPNPIFLRALFVAALIPDTFASALI
ncbi:MAG: hypothetical protein L7T26_06910, partial [Pseudomonadales bacterium]|nr:hypothetical protein [Pseudomonadales bacterium]